MDAILDSLLFGPPRALDGYWCSSFFSSQQLVTLHGALQLFSVILFIISWKVFEQKEARWMFSFIILTLWKTRCLHINYFNPLFAVFEVLQAVQYWMKLREDYSGYSYFLTLSKYILIASRNEKIMHTNKPHDFLY